MFVEGVIFDKIFFAGVGMRKLLLLLVHLFNDASDSMVIMGF